MAVNLKKLRDGDYVRTYGQGILQVSTVYYHAVTKLYHVSFGRDTVAFLEDGIEESHMGNRYDIKEILRGVK